jgi:hypothetical protein
MNEPVAINRAVTLTPKGSFAVALTRLRDSFDELPDADRVWAIEVLGGYLAEALRETKQRTA